MDNYIFLDSYLTSRLDTDPILAYGGRDLHAVNQPTVAQSSVQADLSTYTNRSYESDFVQSSLLIIPLIGWCALITSLLISFFRSEKVIQTSALQRVKQDRSIIGSKQPVPCARCHYFSDNSYVRCAVHPSKAFTVQATDCSDYRS